MKFLQAVTRMNAEEKLSFDMFTDELSELNLHVNAHRQIEVKTVKASRLCVFRVMHDEVSDTENIRKNLAIERMIVEGCDILLDTSQTFVRQGELRSPTRPCREPSLNFKAGSYA